MDKKSNLNSPFIKANISFKERLNTWNFVVSLQDINPRRQIFNWNLLWQKGTAAKQMQFKNGVQGDKGSSKFQISV